MNIQGIETRQQIYEFISKFPGVHFREIKRSLNLAVGTLQYNINQLKKDQLIIAKKDGEYVRFYAIGIVTESEKNILSLLRQKPIRHIVILLLTKEKVNHQNISKELNLSPATTSWYLNKMLESKIADRKKIGREVYYHLTNPDEITKTIVAYKESFLDKIVDRFIEIWEK
jgi:predicted transcriptional regulator